MSQANHDPGLSSYRQAFDQIKPEINGVQDESFIQIAIDIPSAAVTTQGVCAQVIALRPVFVEQLPKFDIALVDKLETYALAMFCAHIDYRAALDPPAELAGLVETAIAKRAILLADVNTLVAYGLLAPEVLDDLLGVNGYKNVMTDLGTLASILRTNAPMIAERTTVKPAELAAAEDLATKLGKTVGMRGRSPHVIAKATRNRQAAFTLFMRAYEKVRVAVQYIRHHEGDADTIMPSLFAGRGGRKKSTNGNVNKPDALVPSPAPIVVLPTPAPSGSNGDSAAKVTISEHGPFVQ